MEDGDLGTADGRTSPYRIQEEYHAHHNRKQDRTDHIEHQMDYSSTLRGLMGTHTGQQRRYTGTDVLSERNINSRTPGHATVHGQRL